MGNKLVVILYCAIFLGLSSTTNEVYGIGQGNCNNSLGFGDGRIKNYQLSASSFTNLETEYTKYYDMKSKYARLNDHLAWCSDEKKNWLMVDLGEVTLVTGIATQGYAAYSNHYYVRHYKLEYSGVNRTWSYIKDGSNSPRIFVGNINARGIVKREFKTAIKARYIKIIPTNYNYKVCLRMELYGCFQASTTTSLPTNSSPATTIPPPKTRTVPRLSSSKPTSTVKAQPLLSKNKTATHKQPSDATLSIVIGCSSVVLLVAFIIIVVAVIIIVRKHNKRKGSGNYCLESNRFANMPLYIEVDEEGMSMPGSINGDAV